MPAAADSPAAPPTEITHADNRPAAMMRTTMESSGSPVNAIFGSSNPTSGEGSDAAGRERLPSPDFETTSLAVAPSRPPETVASTAPAAPDVSLQDRLRVLEQVSHRLETMRLAQGRHEITLHLQPDHLGDLRLTIVAERHAVSASILAETPLARQAVAEGREQLRAALEQKGFTLQGMDVALSQGGSDRRYLPSYPETPQDGPRSYRSLAPVSRPMQAIAPAVRHAWSNGRLDYQA